MDLSTNAKIIRARQKFVDENRLLNETLVSCVFGAKLGLSYPGYVHFNESILGNHNKR
jgi:hypothetical protein